MRALGLPSPPAYALTYTAAKLQYTEAKKIKDVAAVDAALRTVISLASSFDEAWAAHVLTMLGSATRACAFIRAIATAATNDQLVLLFDNCEQNSLLDGEIIRRLDALLNSPLED